jgi:hypothetical protein
LEVVLPSASPASLRWKVLVISVAVVVALPIGFLALEPTTGGPSSGGAGLPSLNGVSVVGYGWGASSGANTTVSMSVPRHFQGAVLVFVSYVNAPSGGNVSEVTSNLAGHLALFYSIGLGQPFTEQLYWGQIGAAYGAAIPPLTVSALTSGGSASMGTMVAVVLVSLTVETVVYFQYFGGVESGTGGNATVGFATNPGGVLVLGVTGPAPATPFSPLLGEALLDTGNAATGPGGASVGFGTFAAVVANSHAQPAALLHTPGPWDAIGLEIVP